MKKRIIRILNEMKYLNHIDHSDKSNNKRILILRRLVLKILLLINYNSNKIV